MSYHLGIENETGRFWKNIWKKPRSVFAVWFRFQHDARARVVKRYQFLASDKTFYLIPLWLVLAEGGGGLTTKMRARKEWNLCEHVVFLWHIPHFDFHLLLFWIDFRIAAENTSVVWDFFLTWESKGNWVVFWGFLIHERLYSCGL